MQVEEKKLVNRIANSGLITIKLEEFFPKKEMVIFDIKDYLFMELILKEKDFRAAMKAHDWEQYEGKHLLIICSVDAIIPVWAYMLITSYVENYANSIFQGTKEEFLKVHYELKINELDLEQYKVKRLIIKGCSDQPVPASAYVALTQKLRPIAKSIMYGEACSTVPIYKQPRK
ncbi:MAG: DUF2480 family protein [Bacteroidota bacterium]